MALPMDPNKARTTRLDAAEQIYFDTHQLTQVLTTVLQEPLRDLPYMDILPVTATINPLADTATWFKRKTYGLAKFVSGYDKGWPRAEVGASKETVSLKRIGMEYGYNTWEIRQSAAFGYPLDAEKVRGALRGLQEKLNILALNGDADHNMQGFLSLPGTTEFTVPNTGTGSVKTWLNTSTGVVTKTADQIIADLNGLVAAITVPTKGKESPNTILVPRVHYLLLKNTRMTTTSDMSILAFWNQNNPDITIKVLDELSTAGASSTARMIAYRNSADKVRFEVPLALESHPEERDGLEYKYKLSSTVAGVICLWPQSIAFGDGI